MGGQVHIRIDNRLLHGQVVQFWIPHLGIQHLIVADDEVAENNSMQAIYRMALPEVVRLTVVRLDGLPAELSRQSNLSTMVLIRDVEDAIRVSTSGTAGFSRLTIGNVHATPGRERITDAVYLSDEESNALLELSDRGIGVEIQTFPGEVLQLVAGKKGGTSWARP